MGKLEKYLSYKDSDVEWLGEIPEHWKVKKIKFVMNKIQTGTTPSTNNKNFFDGDLNWFNPKDLNQEILIDSENKLSQLALDRKEIKLFPKDSILIVGIGATTGKTSYLTINGTFNQQITGFHSTIHHNKFLFYVLRNFSKVFLNVASYTTLPILNNEFFKSFSIVLPPKEEQTKIASSLDEKTAQIDEVISQKEKLIELLKERKQIVINDAVTKGLDKDVEFVDSGVEWIGKIPKHWEVIKFKHLFYEKKKTHDISLNCGSISFGKVIEKNDEKIPASTKASYQVLNKGEFLINPLNLNYDLKSLRIGLSDLDVVVSSGYIIIKNKENIDKIYFNWLLHRYDISFMKTLGAGVRQTLNFGDIAETLLVNPPLEEQIKIAEYIENQTIKIDKAIELQQNYISKLKEYKASLIDSVVTGKVRVV
ncbi:restriction endonuclease subunit S [Aliarcobacter butzleri]|uniref:restriction endonuclease subunit S n=1 Tax=Aliarcobacter butzleri TaxID=28197 RepID=UPI0021B21A1D|nr:restriction endonuclease subunit S [Aliarcobacter butzleri]MCT7627048.1 restriction endonuclease subunit S [Aliarcobacter butzleri]